MNVDPKFWAEIRQTIAGMAMPLQTHQQIQQLLNHVEQVAMANTPAESAKANGANHAEQ